MFLDVLRFVRLPFAMLTIFAVIRFSFSFFNIAYGNRSNSISLVVLAVVSGIYYGAISKKVGGFNWTGTILIGLSIGLFGQILIFSATLISFLGHLDTHFVNGDALIGKPGAVLTMAEGMIPRSVALITGPIVGMIASSFGRGAFGWLAPTPNDGARGK